MGTESNRSDDHSKEDERVMREGGISPAEVTTSYTTSSTTTTTTATTGYSTTLTVGTIASSGSPTTSPSSGKKRKKEPFKSGHDSDDTKDHSMEEMIPLEILSSSTTTATHRSQPDHHIENDDSSSSPSTVVFTKNKDCDVENSCSIKHLVDDENGGEKGEKDREEQFAESGDEEVDGDVVDGDYDYGNYDEEEECLKINEEEEAPHVLRTLDGEYFENNKNGMKEEFKKEENERSGSKDKKDGEIQRKESNEITVISSTIINEDQDGGKELPPISTSELTKGRWMFKKKERKKNIGTNNKVVGGEKSLTVGKTSVKSLSLDDVKMSTSNEKITKACKESKKITSSPSTKIKIFSASTKSYKWVPRYRKKSLVQLAQMEAKMSGANPAMSASTVTVCIQPTPRETLEAKRERKAAKTLAIITGAFVVCWLPFFIIALLLPICVSCQSYIPEWVFTFCLWLGYVNSLINPIIYTIFNLEFRAAFKKMIFGNRFNQNNINRSVRKI